MSTNPIPPSASISQSIYHDSQTALCAGQAGTWQCTLPDGQFSMDQGMFTLLNIEPQKFENNLGSFLNSIHASDRERVKTAFENCLSNKSDLNINFLKSCGGAPLSLFSLRGSIIKQANKTQTALAGICWDISDTKHTEQRVLLAVEAAPNGMVMINHTGQIELVNSKMEEMFGYYRHEMIGQPIEILVPERFRNEHPQNRAKFFSSPNTRAMGANRNLFALRKDGSEFPVEIGLNPIDTIDGIIVLAAVVDITERKRAEIELQKSTKELEQFAYVASHDLKAPLRAIEHLANWILEDVGSTLPQSSQQDLTMLISRVERMNKLLDGLLEYSRIGRLGHSIDHVNVNELVDETSSLLSIPENFQIHIKNTLPTLHVPRAAMLQIIYNLISNAIKHHDKESGNIWISSTQYDSYIVLTIEDDGPGIPLEYHEKVFQMFQTLKPRDTVEGSGMGLAIVKKVIENHGGSIVLRSEQSKGSKFIITWPTHERVES